MAGIATLAALLLAGADPSAAGAELPRRARPVQTLPTLFSHEDYPSEALRNDEEGRVGYRLGVDSEGRPSGCSIESSSGSALLDSTTCRLLMERARFEPARDSQGRATADSAVGAIVWQMEQAPPRLQALQSLWASCVTGEVSKHAPGEISASEVARRAFLPCTELERLVAQEVGKAVPLEEPRAEFAREIAQGLEGVRAVLKAKDGGNR